MIYSIGEALIDIKGNKEYVGGSPLNVALTVARLNSPSAFAGGVSSDEKGRKILEYIIDNCIIFDYQFCLRPEPSMVAGVTVKDGKEEYVFKWKDTSALFMDADILEDNFQTNTDINAIFFGSIAYAYPQSGKTILDFVKKHSDVISFFDPNIRVKAIEDFDLYKKSLEEACKNSDIVKLSEDDLKLWGKSIRQILELSKHHLIITEGENGATWYSKDHSNPIHVDGLNVPVIDTVGCGDCFSGALLHWLDNNGKLNKKDISLSEMDIYQAMFFAVSVSAMNASREGCDPPKLEELV